MYVVVTSFSNDGSARPTTQLKMESTTYILIDKSTNFRTAFFKVHQRKAAPILQKVYCLRTGYEICS